MNKQTSILVAFALAFFVAFALTANEILSNDNLKTEITTSDKSTENTCSSKTEKSCCSKDNKAKEVSIWWKFNSSIIKSINSWLLSFLNSNLSIILCRQVPAIVPFGNSLKGFGWKK